MSHFNTTNEVGAKLKWMAAKTKTQEERVLNIFKSSKTGLTASEVFLQYQDQRTPLTSIRRAITVLAGLKKLVKTTEKREGMFGRNEYVYRLYTGQLILFSYAN